MSPVLLTGASGFVGARLLRALEADGVAVRAGGRDPEGLRERVGATSEVVRLDVLDEATLAPALEGCCAAYYLVHSLDGAGAWEDDDRRAAESFARAAAAAGLERIVYLGGIARDEELSEHLRSRREVGEILRSGAVPTLELRASIVLGPGSLSFETIRSVVGLGPVVPLPEWVKMFSQPIGIDDVVAYLRAALDVPFGESRVIEIGGADRVPYLDVIEEVARQSGLSRRFVTAPVPMPTVSSSVLPEAVASLVPGDTLATVKLVESLRHETTVRDDSAQELFPGIEPLSLPEAVTRALAAE